MAGNETEPLAKLRNCRKHLEKQSGSDNSSTIQQNRYIAKVMIIEDNILSVQHILRTKILAT